MTRSGGVLGRALRTSSADLYAVADLDTARRLGAPMWMLSWERTRAAASASRPGREPQIRGVHKAEDFLAF